MKVIQETLDLLSFRVIYVAHDHKTPAAICAVLAEVGERSPFPVNVFPENIAIPLKAFT